jgi:hypothetical protein
MVHKIDSAMTPTQARRNGKLYRYYLDMHVLKRGATPGSVSRIATSDVERAVIDQLRAILHAPRNHRPYLARGKAEDRQHHRGRGARGAHSPTGPERH